MAACKSLEEIKEDLVAALAPMEGLDKLFIGLAPIKWRVSFR